jgi:hypothetical protein
MSLSYAASLWLNAIPPDPIRDPVEWCQQNCNLPGSARTTRFDSSITPWLRLPLSLINDGVTRIITFVKPVQTGGSVLGEVALCYILANFFSGDVQYNWETDEKATDRQSKRVEPILRATRMVFEKFPSDRHKVSKGLICFPHCNFTIQGVASEGNLASDSIRVQINEEVHGWPAGRLQLAYRRTTAFWNSLILNISNASKTGDQLHQAYLSGSQEQWLVLCPGCGQHHHMQTRWDDAHPELGGLRYDSEGCKNADGTYNYNKLAPTIRYQMPCGHVVKDDVQVRRQMSLGGKWSAPNNPNAHISNRSFTYEAVCVDTISWLGLIEEKHRAIRARNSDDPTLWIQYLNERECQFYDPEYKPWKKAVVLTKDLKKNREGLAGRMARYFALDRQLGIAAKGEKPHWWLVIRDYMPNGDSQLIFEGKLHTSSEVICVLDSHGCRRDHGVADSGADTDHVYAFCLKYGINAIKGGQTPTYKHSDGITQVWSEPKPVFTMIDGAAPLYDYVDGRPDDREPYFWEYSKHNIRNLLAYLMDTTSFATPDDVSEDYTAHMNAMEKKVGRHSRTNEPFEYWEVSKGERRFDLRVCECYCAMLFKMSGKMGAGPKPIEEKPS